MSILRRDADARAHGRCAACARSSSAVGSQHLDNALRARGFGFLRARAMQFAPDAMDLSTCSATVCSPATWRSSPAVAPASVAASPRAYARLGAECASSAASPTCSSATAAELSGRPGATCSASPRTSAIRTRSPRAVDATRRAVRQARHARQRRGRQLPRARGRRCRRTASRPSIEIDLRRHVQRVERRVRGAAQSGDGLVLNISATLHYHGTPLQIHASAAKAGVDAVTQNLAVEWGRFGIRACGIAPGPIGDTEGMKPARARRHRRRRRRPAIPAGRFGTIDEIAAAAVYPALAGGRVHHRSRAGRRRRALRRDAVAARRMTGESPLDVHALRARDRARAVAGARTTSA